MKNVYGNRLFTFVLILSISLFLIPDHLTAQADKRQFLVIEYLKVKPTMRSNFLKLQKDVWKKVEQEKRKQGKIDGWELHEVLYPAGTAAEYNYVMYHRVVGWNAIEGISEGNDDIFKKVLSKEELAMMERSPEVEEMTKKEIWLIEDKIGRAAYVAPPKYHSANFMDVTDGKWDDYMEMEKTLVKPIHEEHTRTGGRAGWTLLALPGRGARRLRDLARGSCRRVEFEELPIPPQYYPPGGSSRESWRTLFYANLIRSFIDEILDPGRPAEGDFADGAWVEETINAVELSFRERRWVSLPLE